MRTGKTKTGFEYKIAESALDNMELVDALAELDEGNTTVISRICKLLFGNEQKKALYNHLRTAEGNVPVAAFTQEIFDIFEQLKDGKNS